MDNSINLAPLEIGPETEIFQAAERLCARDGLRNVTVRAITSEAGVNVAALSYYYRSKDELLFAIFRRRGGELNAERGRLLDCANERFGGAPPVREILSAFFAPMLSWYFATDERRLAIQFILRVRSEGTERMRRSLQRDVKHLDRFATALEHARPDLSMSDIYWRLHFCQGLSHNIRTVDLERLQNLAGDHLGAIEEASLLQRMLDFAEAGFRG